MSLVKVKCYCGKWLDDPTHKNTHQDKFLTHEEYGVLNHKKTTECKFRSSKKHPWKILVGHRVGDNYHIIGIYNPTPKL